MSDALAASKCLSVHVPTPSTGLAGLRQPDGVCRVKHCLLVIVQVSALCRAALCCGALSCCSVNDNRCNSSSVLKVLLDPFVPITRTLPLVVEAIFGGRRRFGVPKLGVRLHIWLL